MAIKDEYQTQENRISERKHILHKNFIKDFLLGLFFIAVFTGAFLISWNNLVGWIINRGHTIWICVCIAFFTASLITFLTNFLIFKMPGYIKKRRREKALKKRSKRLKKDQKNFLDS